jgi:hypothetical protein
MSTMWKAAAIAAMALATSACANLNAYAPGAPTRPMDATFNLASERTPDLSHTSGKLDGRSGSAVVGTTGI